jgi:hypothetical protein
MYTGTEKGEPMTTRAVCTAAVLLFTFTVSTNARAQLTKQERAQAAKMFAGELYLRVDAPCDYGRMVPMLEVSPAGTNTARRISELTESDRPNLYWDFGPNDAIQSTQLRWGINSVRVWAEGVSPHRNEIMVDFVQIKTMDDFKKAFDLTFSATPLHEAHPEWPAETRTAIKERQLIEGMTKEQVSCVIGAPASTKVVEAAGGLVERWYPRQENGVRPMFKRGSLRTGFPASLEFVDGKLAKIEPLPAPSPGARKN